MHMITDGSRNADAARRTLGLKSRCYIHCIAVEVRAIGNRIAKVDPYAEADGPVGWMIGS